LPLLHRLIYWREGQPWSPSMADIQLKSRSNYLSCLRGPRLLIFLSLFYLKLSTYSLGSNWRPSISLSLLKPTYYLDYIGWVGSGLDSLGWWGSSRSGKNSSSTFPAGGYSTSPPAPVSGYHLNQQTVTYLDLLEIVHWRQQREGWEVNMPYIDACLPSYSFCSYLYFPLLSCSTHSE